MFRSTLPAVAVVALMLGAGSAHAESVHLDYSDVVVSFDPMTSIFTIADHDASSLRATLLDGTETVSDRADIMSASSFNLSLSTSLLNPVGFDNISLAGLVDGTDTDVASGAAFVASFANTPFGQDLDGVTFAGGILAISGDLGATDGPLLADPFAGDWVFTGTTDAPTGPGADGVSNQFTVPAGLRPGFTSGTAFFVDIAIPVFGDGTSTLLATNGDEFFALALEHGGFDSAGGDFKIVLTPEPTTSLLLMVGTFLATRRRAENRK